MGSESTRARWLNAFAAVCAAASVIVCVVAWPGAGTHEAEVLPPLPSATDAAPGPAPTNAAPPTNRARKSPEPVPIPPAPARPMELFAQHCAVCHGDEGRGDGPAAAHLNPRPWSFESAVFKWGTCVGGMASDEDLLRTLRRGVPGTAMPSHADLPDADLRDLIEAVKYLALKGSALRVREADHDMTGAEVLAYAKGLVTAGPAVVIPPRVARTGPAPDAGKTPGAFLRACAECHGPDGTAAACEDPESLLDQMGRQDLPRNYTREVFRGGSSEQDVALRMLRGIPGSPMAMAEIVPQNPEFWEVLDWVRARHAGVESESAVQARQSIAAVRTATLPATGADPAWDAAPVVRVPLMALRRHVEVPLHVEVRALHDGRCVAFRLSWKGPAHEIAGAAVRLLADAPAGFRQGEDAPGAVARWTVGRAGAAAAAAPDYVPLSGLAAERVSGKGSGERAGDGWSVVLSMDLPAAGRTDLVIGAWDGAAQDGRLHEGVTVRHTLDVRR